MDLLKATHVQEGLLRQIVAFTLDDGLEGLNGVGNWGENTGLTGEHLSDEERLRQEALNTASPVHHNAVLFGQFVHTKDGDDVLEFL